MIDCGRREGRGENIRREARSCFYGIELCQDRAVREVVESEYRCDLRIERPAVDRSASRGGEPRAEEFCSDEQSNTLPLKDATDAGKWSRVSYHRLLLFPRGVGARKSRFRSCIVVVFPPFWVSRFKPGIRGAEYIISTSKLACSLGGARSALPRFETAWCSAGARFSQFFALSPKQTFEVVKAGLSTGRSLKT